MRVFGINPADDKYFFSIPHNPWLWGIDYIPRSKLLYIKQFC